ncbi:MAG: hypothetical protein FWF97_03115 [Alphaproteobacteria bacterium]|nr:hypothetical protein [Alphaproteobacteria bacterium]
MVEKHDKLLLAEQQLEAACVSYSGYNEFRDYISAITLAGVASEIFHQYLKLNKQKTIAIGVADVFKRTGDSIAVPKIWSALRNLSINYLKHRKLDDPLYLTMNSQKEARMMILMTMIDHQEAFKGQQNPFIRVCAYGLEQEYIKEIDKEFPEEKIYYKDIAVEQLKSSMRMFLAGQYAAAITLAGAADSVLTSLLETDGRECFLEHVKKTDGSSGALGEFRKEVNDMMSINSIKHLDSLEDRYIEADILQNAVGAILKTLPNYKILDEEAHNKSVEVRAFLRWCKTNLDPAIYHVDKI